jgi:hypothetical protein
MARSDRLKWSLTRVGRRLNASLGLVYRRRATQLALSPVEGPLGLLTRRRDVLAHGGAPTATEGLLAFSERWQPDDEGDEPVFVLSAGWRSGSTLLQRLLISSRDVLVWGEPFHDLGLVQRLAASFARFATGWPPDDHFLDRDKAPEELAMSWTAVAFPSAAELIAAHRAFYLALLGEPARRLGYARWGLKEVRFGSAELRYLRLLYPRAKMILLVRDPVASWTSYRRFSWPFYDRWPDKPIVTAAQFARTWKRLAADFLEFTGQDERVRLVTFESLMAGPATLRSVEDFLDLTVNPDTLQHRQTGPADLTGSATPIERRIILGVTGPLRARFGYE